jgi:hypothetical protein
MAERMPTLRGDVLILWTTQSYAVHAIGRVSTDGQQDLGGEANVKNEVAYAAAMARAKALLVAGGRIFFRNIDTGDWKQIAH